MIKIKPNKSNFLTGGLYYMQINSIKTGKFGLFISKGFVCVCVCVCVYACVCVLRGLIFEGRSWVGGVFILGVKNKSRNQEMNGLIHGVKIHVSKC